MKKYIFMTVFLVVMAFFLVGIRYVRQGKVVLGPKLPSAMMPNTLARNTGEQLRTWVENLKESDARRLNSTGKLLLSWSELTNSYPEQARIIDNYLEQSRLDMRKAFEQKYGRIPERLAAHHPPDTVEIKSFGGGGIHSCYEF